MEKHAQLNRAVVLCTLILALPPTAWPRTIRVATSGSADFTAIQAAIDDANDGDTVLVTPGTYAGDGNRDIDFKGKAITVKSEQGPKSCIIQCGGHPKSPGIFPRIQAEYHRGFYFHSGEDANSVVQGFTVTGGYMGPDDGGAVYCKESGPIVRDCIIMRNTACRGGGISAYRSSIRVENCIIVENKVGWTGHDSGGGISSSHSNACIVNCLIAGNTAQRSGGGISCEQGDHEIVNCTIAGNRTGDGGMGGGISLGPDSGYTCYLRNSIVWSNTAGASGNDIALWHSAPVLWIMRARIECSLIGDDPNDLYDPHRRANGGWITGDPQFVAPGYWDPNGTPDDLSDDFRVDGEYHLKSQAGRWAPQSQSWVMDDVTSPCIDAGDPNSPVGEEPQPNGGRINMGAYGGTAEASKSYVPHIIYVDASAAGASDGSSWVNAYRYLQDALADANDSDKPVEVRVAGGIYRPDQRSVPAEQFLPPRFESFTLADDVTIKGGFAGVHAPDPNARDITLYESILSGDLAGNDVPVLDPCDLLTEQTRADNSIAVVRAWSCSRSAVLDGFAITAGSAMGIDSRTMGGSGLYMSGVGKPCLPSIRNCTFRDNLGGPGGAILVKSAAPEITNCTFLQNASMGNGGAMNVFANNLYSAGYQVEVKKCAFIGNHAQYAGGAIYVWGGTGLTVIEGNTFWRNSAGTGGALHVEDRQPASVRNCLFIRNTAEQIGGAVCSNAQGLDITSCTFWENMAPQGTGIACREPPSKWIVRSVWIANTILRDGGDEIHIGAGAQVDVTYSNIQGGWPGEGNIDIDPCFAAPGCWDPNGTPDDPNVVWVNGDYHLKSQAGRWDAENQSWVVDDVTSPCIDVGDPNSPVGDEPFPNGGRINMGAYGGTAEASMSYLAGPGLR